MRLRQNPRWQEDVNLAFANPEVVEHWHERARTKWLPPSFSDAQVETEFLFEYRAAALQSIRHACALGIAAYIAIGSADIVTGGWNFEHALRRLIAISLLLFIFSLISLRPHVVLRNYGVLLGSLGFITIVGLISLIHLYRVDDVTALITPISLIVLWILYGFVRLPIEVAILVGTVGGLFAMFGSRLTNMHEPGIKTFIYLVVANALGFLLAKSIEARERQLFLQRWTAESVKLELEQRTRDAEDASAEKTRLLAAVAHDLRQPMLSAVLHAEVLSHRLAAGDMLSVKRQASKVEESVKVLGDTLEHLLTAARYDAGTEPVLINNVSVARLFHRLRDLFDSEALEKGIVLRIQEPAAGLSVSTDERALLRILMNLVSNAIKFTPPRENARAGVIVKAIVRDSTCRIVVSDSGVGIAKGNLNSIWEPFFQVGNEERNRRKGLGLGLYLVKQSLRRLDRHSVSVRSSPTRGTRFIVSLPEASSDRMGVMATGIEGNAGDSFEEVVDQLRGLHVALIEDDQEARDAIEALLSEWQIRCYGGIGPEQVSKLCEGKRVDRIIADFRLPGKQNGADAIRALRQNLGYSPPAILITAEVDRDKLLTLLPQRTIYLAKPFDANALRSSLLA